MFRNIRSTATVAGAVALALVPLSGSPIAAQSTPAAHGINLAGMDRSRKPGDDFFKFANGTWDRTTQIPADRASWGVDGVLAEEAALHTRELLEGVAAARVPADADERKAADYYAAYIDVASREARGVSRLKPTLDRIRAISDRRALAQELGSELRADVDPLNATNFHTDHLFGLWVAQDLNDPMHNAAYLLQGGLAMPDREYYVSDNPKMVDTRSKYSTHVTKVLQLAGIADADATAQRIIALETKIARVHAAREASEDVHNVKPWARADFDSHAPGLDWATYFKAAGLDAPRAFVVWQPEAIVGESALAASEPIDAWKDYLSYIVLNHWSSLLTKAFADERFDFFGRTLSGTPQMPDAWKRAVASTNGAMGDAVGKLYVAKYFPPASKTRAQAMVANIKAAFAQRIDRLDWMSAATKTKAKQKLDTLIVGVGYPDKWRDYAALDVKRDDALGNAMRAEEFEYTWRLKELQAPIDRGEWWMTPQTVNAVNLPLQNALNFPAAILQPPYFDANAPDADNYGAIGAVIGHEVSHSFDDQGSQFDASGKLANWWGAEDFAHFKSASARLVAQYNA
jgi:putative endopeptidase